MENADSTLRGALLWLSSPAVLAALLAAMLATIAGFAVARVLRLRNVRERAATTPARPLYWPDHTLEGAVLLAPIFVALAVLLAAHMVLPAVGISSVMVDEALRVTLALVAVRFGVYVLALLLGPASWVRLRESRITVLLWLIVAIALLGWLDVIEASLNRVSLVPGKTQFSLWALLKGLVVVSAFVIVASLFARAIERHVMRLDQVAVST
ncbi:MAG: hypothetical protein JO341_09155, partial [Gammaproteobacteria bacterium]|nr:hypothetical protein [Gammaproteobacteria bacterium]